MKYHPTKKDNIEKRSKKLSFHKKARNKHPLKIHETVRIESNSPTFLLNPGKDRARHLGAENRPHDKYKPDLLLIQGYILNPFHLVLPSPTNFQISSPRG